ncbi:unnamed protein product [Enterobius vermicularis]|uniref:Pkinase_fungal domain-containing protein n=1 Tax=Enterobius vermicularis TaxID=51028 RepID=A0A0N4UXG0_ENTVE|nr:unnamed protein product [Enterobius vermicularis]
MSPHKNVKNPRTDKAVIVLRILLYVDLDGYLISSRSLTGTAVVVEVKYEGSKMRKTDGSESVYRGTSLTGGSYAGSLLEREERGESKLMYLLFVDGGGCVTVI